MASSRSTEIVRARDQLHDVLTAMRNADNSPNGQLGASALAAGLSLLVGVALDLNRIADALEADKNGA